MAVTQLRGSNQILDNTVTRAKLVTDFVDGATWNLSSTNTAVVTGLAAPTNVNDAANKGYVDGLVDSSMKSPDGYATVAAADYPTNYKATGTVAEGDMFYITSVAGGTLVGTETVNVGDALVALVDAPGNTSTNWIIMEANRDQATETVKGVSQIATQVLTDAGVNDTDYITPLKLDTYLSNANIQAYQGGSGITVDVATTPDSFDLGGTLNKAAIIDAVDNEFRVDGSDGMGETSYFKIDTGQLSMQIDNANPGNGSVGNTTLALGYHVSGGVDFGMVVTQSGTNGDTGKFVYAADYSASFQVRSIVDKGYVDNAITASAITADNGLTKTGNNIQLGGGLLGNTALNINDFNLEFTTTTNSVGDISFGSVATRLNAYNVYTDNGIIINDTNTVNVASDTVNINGTTGVILTASAAGVVVADAPVDNALLANQPTGGTALSIATTQYVDNAVTAGTVTASNGLTKVGSDIQLGGTLTSDIAIDSDGTSRNVSFGGTTSVNGFEVVANVLDLTSSGSATFAGGTVTFIGNNSSVSVRSPINGATLTSQPTGAVALAIATTQYVDNAVAGTEVYNELPAVTGGSSDVTIANAPTAGTVRVYLNGIRQAPGAANDYTIAGTTVTFGSALIAGDAVVLDYKY